MRSSTPDHWQRFWEQADDIALDEVYGTDGRMVREVMLLGPPAGKRVLEVGAGTGRDGIELARRGAFVVALDYSSASLRMIRSQLGGDVPVALCCGDDPVR